MTAAQASLGVVGGAPAGAPSLVQSPQALGKNNFPQATGRRRRAYLPCPKLPGRRIRLQNPEGHTCLLKCKGWVCSGCGPWMKDRFIKVASAEARRLFKVGRFLTLTLDADARDLDVKDRFKLMSATWKRFVARVNRLPTHYVKCIPGRTCPTCIEPCGERAVPVVRNLNAIWVREAHLDGTPHLHVLVDRFIPQAWISLAWKACGGGPVVDIKRVSIGRVVAYVTKYLAKSLGARNQSSKNEGGGPDGLRRVRRYGTTGQAKLRGIYPEKRTDSPWRIWWKPGQPKGPAQDWRAVERGEEKYVIAWVSRAFGDGLATPADVQRWGAAWRNREARLRAEQGRAWRAPGAVLERITRAAQAHRDAEFERIHGPSVEELARRRAALREWTVTGAVVAAAAGGPCLAHCNLDGAA